MPRSNLGLLAALAIVGAACAPGKPAEVVRPTSPSATAALGEKGCAIKEDQTTPLVID